MNNTFSNSSISNYSFSQSISNHTITATSLVDSDMPLVVASSKIIVGGRDILDELDQIRKIIPVIFDSADMESKFPKLKMIREDYEAELEKYKTFSRLQDSK